MHGYFVALFVLAARVWSRSTESTGQVIALNGWNAVATATSAGVMDLGESDNSTDCLGRCGANEIAEDLTCRLVAYNNETKACNGYTTNATYYFTSEPNWTLLAHSDKTFLLQDNVDYTDKDIMPEEIEGKYIMSDQQGAVSEPETCVTLCKIHPACNGVSVWKERMICWLKYIENPQADAQNKTLIMSYLQVKPW